jgi:MSHA pilin protein MshD
MRRHVQGVTLVELLVSIVIISIAVISVMGALSAVAANSASAMLQEQGTSIASAYLNEILQKNFADPDATPSVEASRDLYDDVSDYTSLPDAVVRDPNGAAIAGLGQFQVQVAVSAGNLNGLGAGNVLRVDVTVSHPSMASVMLTGYRTRY